MKVTATEAKNRFGALCAQAKSAPVFIEKSGRIDSVILSIEDYRRANPSPAANAPSLSPEAQRFYEENKDWIDRQNDIVAKHGLWSDGLVDWLSDGSNPDSDHAQAELASESRLQSASV